MKKVREEDELVALLKRGQIRPEDLQEDQKSADALVDELDKLVVNPDELRAKLGLARKP